MLPPMGLAWGKRTMEGAHTAWWCHVGLPPCGVVEWKQREFGLDAVRGRSGQRPLSVPHLLVIWWAQPEIVWRSGSLSPADPALRQSQRATSTGNRQPSMTRQYRQIGKDTHVPGFASQSPGKINHPVHPILSLSLDATTCKQVKQSSRDDSVHEIALASKFEP
jgi:hypothetical protein